MKTEQTYVSDNLIREPEVKVQLLFIDKAYCFISENILKDIPQVSNSGTSLTEKLDINRVLKELKKDRKHYKNYSIFDLLKPILMPSIDFELPKNIYFPHKLFSYQIEGIKFLLSKEFALLADQMGTGKTVMSVTAMRILFLQGKIKKAVIIVPSNLISVWEEHLTKWVPELIFITLNENKKSRRLLYDKESHIYLVSYDTLKSDYKYSKELIKKFSSNIDLIILDEAHNIKNPEALKTKAVKFVAKNSKIRWALSGTPLQNNLKELLSLYEFLNPQYERRKNLNEEEARELIKPVMLRRLKKDVLKDLPEKLPPEIEKFELSPLQKAEYDYILGRETERLMEIYDRFKGEKNFRFIMRQNVIQSIQKLRQVCNFPSKSIESPKMERLREMVIELIRNREKVVVFTNFVREGVEKIIKNLSFYVNPKSIVSYHGKMNEKEKREAVRRFREEENVYVFVATIGTAGEGLTLVESSYAVFFDLHWNPAKMWQAEDRIHRIGQKNKVSIYNFVMKNTVEEKILQKINEKKALISSVMDGMESKEEEIITVDELLDMVGLTT
ncbi:DEAD/DEAH box helicase [Persephonella atlantica]|uniref:DEAD/DEAH box helicase n=1 Tax=Persephonella atlantica TaxID=2699429 RepID=A0ABS1GI37_9AQUI|nr:DEAD/DEAH box helicase [Persephonella atlantica]MBK3332589.1 DEAD/DEAH box helicase [Persephonella atlantica]